MGTQGSFTLPLAFSCKYLVELKEQQVHVGSGPLHVISVCIVRGFTNWARNVLADGRNSFGWMDCKLARLIFCQFYIYLWNFTLLWGFPTL